MWGATVIETGIEIVKSYFNPRTPMWGATLLSTCCAFSLSTFGTGTHLVGGDINE